MLTINKITGYSLLIAGVLLFTSCEKVIDIDLNDTANKVVVEGIVSDEAGKSKVLLSTTKNFDEDNTYAGVAGATVTVTDNTGNITAFTETSAGVYEAPTLVGVTGKTYSLNVVSNGKTFTASSTMPVKMNIDTVFASDELLFGDATKLVNYAYQDPTGKGNSLRFVQYINGLKSKTIFIRDDDYVDGNYVESKLWYFGNQDDDDDKYKVKKGDKIDIEVFCITPENYKYWFSLDQSATGAGQSASPANPVTNVKGGALGYFSAQTYQAKTFIVP